MHPLEIPVLETERLRVRRLVRADLDAVHEMRESNQDAGPAEEQHRRRMTEQWLDWTVRSYDQLEMLYQPPYGERGVEHKEDQALVGVVGLVPSFDEFGCLPSFGGETSGLLSPEVGLYWMTHRDRQGRGYASEAAKALVKHAFGHLRVRRLVATTDHGNTASIAVMRKLGMRIERTPNARAEHLQTVGILLPPRSSNDSSAR